MATAIEASPTTSGKNLKPPRARKACIKCREKKSKCDLQQRGTPCTTCEELGVVCEVRPRKNARIKRPLTFPVDVQLYDGSIDSQASPVIPGPSQQQAAYGTVPTHTPSQVQYQSEGLPAQDAPSIGSSSYYDLTTFADLEDIFSTTLNDNFGISYAADQQRPLFEVFPSQQRHGINSSIGAVESHPVILTQHTASLSPEVQTFLESQGCLNLPSSLILRRLMELYFSYVHHNLPIVDENRVWSMWSGDVFALGDFSYLLMRAMVFAAIHLLPPETVCNQLGFSSKRQARSTYYNQAKLLFSFNVEHDPISNAQACLIMTYYAPNHNFQRINTNWLSNAAHFARIAGANSFPSIQKTEPERARILKRLWWGLVTRDCILSLALRRSPMIEQPATIADESHLLDINDFEPELGRSPIHDRGTQIRLVEISTAMCRLCRCLTGTTGALNILYKQERVDDRLADVAIQTPATVRSKIGQALARLGTWHYHAMKCFPSPLTLDLDDNSSGAVSIFGNLLIVCHDLTVFGLHQHEVLLEQAFGQAPAAENNPAERDHVSNMEAAVSDVSMRIRELLQARLARYLPISVSAFISLPLILQAVNVTAARGHEVQESTEARKLEVLRRILETQVSNFEGSDFISLVMTNIVSYVENGRLLEGGRGGKYEQPRAGKAEALMWPELMRYRPKLLLRLLCRLDATMCTGGLLGDDGFPQDLR